MSDILERYLNRAGEINRDLQAQTINMPGKPTVTPMEKEFSFPATVWDNPDFGDLDAFIEYIRDVNRIPRTSILEVAFEEHSRALRVRFIWWSVVILTPRNAPRYGGA